MAPAPTAPAAAKPPSAMERTAERLRQRIESARRLCTKLRTRLDCARDIYSGPQPTTPGGKDMVSAADPQHVDGLESMLGHLLDEANALADSLGEYLP